MESEHTNEIEKLIDEMSKDMVIMFGGDKSMYIHTKSALVKIYEETMKLNIMQNSKNTDKIVINIEKLEIHF